MARDRVSPELHDEVLRRDGRCIAFKMDPAHRCFTQFGEAHRPDDKSKLELDHVHLHPGGTKGKRAPGRRENLVAMCGRLNNRPPSAEVREAERSYLLKRYPGATCCDRRAS